LNSKDFINFVKTTTFWKQGTLFKSRLPADFSGISSFIFSNLLGLFHSGNSVGLKFMLSHDVYFPGSIGQQILVKLEIFDGFCSSSFPNFRRYLLGLFFRIAAGRGCAAFSRLFPSSQRCAKSCPRPNSWDSIDNFTLKKHARKSQ
jgi:hypothetical protein